MHDLYSHRVQVVPLVFGGADGLRAQRVIGRARGQFRERALNDLRAAFVAPFWEVEDTRALGFAGAFYTLLLQGKPLGEAMRTDLPSVPPVTSEAETAELMRTHYTRHLLVEEKGQVVGIISMRDVIQLMLDDKQFLIEQLQTYIDGR